MATMRDVAKLAGVSHGTVSNVINGSPGVSLDKIERVQSAMRQLGYKQNTLARIMRRECRKRGIDRLKVVYSTEPPTRPAGEAEEDGNPGRRDIPGSMAFVPSAAGLIIAGEVIRSLAMRD